MRAVEMVRRLGATVGLVFVVSVAVASSASAVTLNGGCKGSGTSMDSSGATKVDEAVAPGAGGTKSKPFIVDYEGTVKYQGSSPTVFKNHHWEVKLFGITVKSGGSPNSSGKTSTEGVAVVKDYLPFRFTGLYHVSGSISSAAGSCSGNMWVKLAGSPVGTVPWVAGIVLGVGGLALLVWSLPTSRVV